MYINYDRGIAMFKKIKRINKFNIFQDFLWNDTLDEFKQYNLIYGWNGSGKTTLSKFFRQIEQRAMCPHCEGFVLDTENGRIDEKNITSSSINIKVFNEDFVKENIFTDSGEVNPIFYLGQEDITSKKKLKSLKNDYDAKTGKKDDIKKKCEIKRKQFEQFCSDKAKNINEFLHSAGENKYNRYDKRSFKKRCEILKSDQFLTKICSPEQIDKLKKVTNSNPKDTILPIQLEISNLDLLNKKINDILEKTVTARVIDRLNLNDELNHWVKCGLTLVKDQGLIKCPFCDEKLSTNLIDQLEGHFNNEYDSLIQEIDSSIQEICTIQRISAISLPSKTDFYEDFSSLYEIKKESLLEEIVKFNNYLKILHTSLEEKRKNPFVKKNKQYPPTQFKIKEKIENVNLLINNHNKKTANFNSDIDDARKNVEIHFVASNLNDYLKNEAELKQFDTDYAIISQEIKNLHSQIIDLEKNIIEHRAPAEEINSDLHSYLGHREIIFDVMDEGYQILRNGENADALSEGEKTAISFIYFLKTLHDKDFDIRNSVVVIDDPISSLDSNSLYTAFSFLKNRTEDAKQLIILTHNFSFFKEVKNWLINKRIKPKSSFYMLKNPLSDGRRIAEICTLDSFLIKYTSEYHYLFSLVYANANSPNQDLENYYLLPNISRRLLESFLAFRYPNLIGNLGNQINKTKVESEKKIRIMRYANANSHSDHIRIDTEADLSYLEETQEVMKDILDLIKTEDEKHYCAMISIIESS